MAVSSAAGPLIVYGQSPAQAGTNYQPDYNSDTGPSAFALGTVLLDPRYGYRNNLTRTSAVAGGQAAVGFFIGCDILVIDQVPATASATNIVASANATTAALTLVTSTAAGITVSSSAVTLPQSGTTLAAGTVFIDSAPAMINFGTSGAVGVIDPRTMIGRAVSVTVASSGTATSATVRGYDVYGFAVTEIIALTAGQANNGAKGFKAISSVTLNAADSSHAYSVGTQDVFEFPIAAYFFNQTTIVWNNAQITANTGFTAAVTTTATGSTGSVRGTYAVQSASDGTKRLQVTVSPSPVNIASATGTASLFGVQQYAG
jgi:hypothetical protein